MLDVRAKVNEEKLVDIEMQRVKETHFVKRILLYTGAFIRGQLETGNMYEELKDTIMISILDHNMFEKTKDYHTIWKLRDESHPELGNLEGLEMHFIELEKYRKENPDMHNKLNQWLALIDTEDIERIDVAMKENEKVKEAINKVNDFMSDEEAKEIVRLREKWQMDYDSSISYAEKKGHDKGILENKIEIAKKLLDRKIKIEEIADITNLSKDEILKLKNND